MTQDVAEDPSEGSGFAGRVRCDPLWERSVEATDFELALLARPELQRLAGLAHQGASARATGCLDTRLDHTLGVWTLIASLCPDDAPLRVAALVHEVGHAPYSRALEGLGGLDHHRTLHTMVTAGDLGRALEGAGFSPLAIPRVANGEIATPLCSADGSLNADGLDSSVRAARCRRTRSESLPPDARWLLERVEADADGLAFAPEAAAIVARLVLEEAEFRLSALDVGARVWLAELVARLLDDGTLERGDLAALREDELDRMLAAHPATRLEFAAVAEGRARFEPASGASARWDVTARPGYLSRPRVRAAGGGDWQERIARAYAPVLVERLVRVDLVRTEDGLP
jgi:uncharacterized protein